jgi:anaerobic selenocysteine-containing dehydrogenase
MTLALNVTLGAFDAGLFDEIAVARPSDYTAALQTLTTEMKAGNVQMLIVAGPNPAYDAPAALGLADAIAKVPYVVSLNDRLDETTLLADVLAPASHAFECWNDESMPGGYVAVQQPVIQALHDTRGLLDVLVDWAAAFGDPEARAAIAAALPPAAPPAAATAQRAPSPSPAFHYLRAAWATRLGLDPATTAFENAWMAGTFGGCSAPYVPRRRPDVRVASREDHGNVPTRTPVVSRPGARRRPFGQQRLVARVAESHHPPHLGRSVVDRAAAV